MDDQIVVGERVAVVESETGTVLHRLTDIPVVLFSEISERLGIGDEEEVILHVERKFRFRRLNPEHRATGFAGAIGLGEWTEDNRDFVIWGRPPRHEDREYYDEPRVLLRIHAFPADGGIWAAGRGTYIREKIAAELEYHGYDLKGAAATLIGLCIMRAGELARDPSCVSRAFWEPDRW